MRKPGFYFAELGHDVPIRNLSRLVLVNDCKEIDRTDRVGADLTVTLDSADTNRRVRRGKEISRSKEKAPKGRSLRHSAMLCCWLIK
jgi:hypothetical protein